MKTVLKGYSKNKHFVTLRIIHQHHTQYTVEQAILRKIVALNLVNLCTLYVNLCNL